jgi:hypothetical protein
MYKFKQPEVLLRELSEPLKEFSDKIELAHYFTKDILRILEKEDRERFIYNLMLLLQAYSVIGKNICDCCGRYYLYLDLNEKYDENCLIPCSVMFEREKLQWKICDILMNHKKEDRSGEYEMVSIFEPLNDEEKAEDPDDHSLPE